MILVGNQRGGAKDMALHLLKPDNEHVDVYELRGFVSDNLVGALNEVYAISRATKCKQFQGVKNLLGRVHYTGYLDIPHWGIHMQPGKHEALISYETFQHIQERMNGQTTAPAREDIPLKGFVTCCGCDKI